MFLFTGDFPDRYLMTARKKGGASASQFVISMDDGEDAEESNVVGRLKATTRTSEEFQVSVCLLLLLLLLWWWWWWLLLVVVVMMLRYLSRSWDVLHRWGCFW